MTQVQQEIKQENSFSIENMTLEWKLIESRFTPREMTLEQLPPRLQDLTKALMVTGVIGSVQIKRIFFKNDKKFLSMAKDFGIVAEHSMIRNGNRIPIYTLGLTGVSIQKQLGGTKPLNYWISYTANDVMKCIMTYQLLGRYRTVSETTMNDISLFTPFEAEFWAKGGNGTTKYAIGVLRSESDVQSFDTYFRIGQDLPGKMIFIVTDLKYMKKLEPIIKPFLNDIRVVVDKNLKEQCSFREMFYVANENGDWIR